MILIGKFSIARAREIRETGNTQSQINGGNWKLLHSASYTQPIGTKISILFYRGLPSCPGEGGRGVTAPLQVTPSVETAVTPQKQCDGVETAVRDI